MIRAALLATLAAGPVAGQHGGHEAPYGGMEDREIAALSPSDIDALRAGEGWGLALPAELNGHPGPVHLLENADALGLDEGQRAAIRASWEAMNADARALGAALIEAEAALDAAFEAGGLDASRLDALVAEAADARGRLRARHLAAHLEVTPLLTRHQIATYDRLRGYGDGHGGH